jgi:hypothetical protein
MFELNFFLALSLWGIFMSDYIQAQEKRDLQKKIN